MSRINRTYRLIVIALCALAAACVVVGLPQVAQAYQTEASVPVSQMFVSDDAAVDSTFTYTFTALDYTASTPMPAGSVGETYTFNMVGTADSTIDVDCSAAPDGTYEYLVKDASVQKPGYTYEQRSYTVRIYVASSRVVATTVERDSDQMKVSRIDLDPTYQTPLSPLGTIDVTKKADDAKASAGGLINYTIRVESSGSVSAVGVWIKDYIPEHTTYVSCDNDGVFTDDGDRGYVNWFISNMSPGDVLELHLTVRVDSDVTSETTISNVALNQVTGSTDPPDFTKDPSGSASNKAATTIEPASSSASVKTGDAPWAIFFALAALCAAGIVALSYAHCSREDR